MTQKTKILLAEDEPSLGQIVKESLETRGFEVVFCKDGKEAESKYHEYEPHLLVLDVMMPKMDGFTLAKEIRRHDKNTPIIFLTAKSQTHDVVEGFTIGGNDYLKKPFSIEELIVRIDNLLNSERVANAEEESAIGQYLFDPKKQTLQFNKEEPVSLTYRESQLLFYLNKNRNEVLDRSFILKKLWQDDDFFSARSMDVFISRLRKKLKKDETVQIVNVRGYGYKLIC
ncbi:MAG: response regulator transcription factor [Bacteroidia bacterium]|nr:response regulator transcription factor [Bacteroidia bacterium]NNF29815.1 response regulator transcription factor [Flavobacteriaceae bacterium]MBT8275985.1 response regulator transcription factor [Bacteroidia bacterium]NNJ80817.1 response regulator transcription factor [Flavobacteriaceae bacterium]NNK55357.1 response regulator transcription factor [Flavobacteriaceae bacterium]